MKRLLTAAMLVLVGLGPAWCDNELATLAGPQLAKAAEGFVRQAETDPKAVVTCDVTISDQKVPQGHLELRPHWNGTAPAPLPARLTIPVAIVVNGQTVREVGVPCRIQVPDAAKVSAIRRGDPVTLVLSGKDGALRVEIPGVAREPGAVGDSIKAEILSTHTLLAGRISAEHKVVVP